MTGFSLKPEFTGNSNSNTPSVDWNAINSQVPTDNHLAIISQIVDLGIHTPDLSANTDKSTSFETQEAANDFVAQVKPMLPKAKADGVTITPLNGKFVVNAEIRQAKDRQEVAIFADLPDNIVDYGNEVGKKPYRVLLNKSHKGEIRGLGLTQVPPVKQGGVWTFPPASLLTELANVTKQTVIIDGTDKAKLNDIGLLLGKALMVDVVQSSNDSGSVYVNVKGVGSVPSKLEKLLDFSLVKPFGISFANATLELLKAAGVRGAVIKKIKQANNYQGSNMQKAIEALEAEYRNGGEAPAQTQATQAPKAESNAAAVVTGTTPVNPDDDALPF